MNSASFTVWTYSPRVVVEEALKADGIVMAHNRIFKSAILVQVTQA